MVRMFLILNEWTVRATGEEKSCYFYTPNPRKKIALAHGQTGVWSPVTTQGADDVAPIWMGEMTEEMYDIYVDEGYDQLMLNLKTGDTTYCGANLKAESTSEATQPTA
mgnify:FL=1